MTSKKTTRRALFSSIMALLLCCSMLVGTTFAWFTDSVTSTGNIIKSGTLDVEMYYGDDASSISNDASVGAIFNYDLWEPGFTQTKYVKVKNVGDLAFQYRLHIIPNAQPAAGAADLADVIDVYAAKVDATYADRSDAMDAANKIGTLSELIAKAEGTAHGTLLPEAGKGADGMVAPADAGIGETVWCITLHMQESAGNEYQNLSVGEGFAVQLLATQLTAEFDSFGNDYDTNAVWPGEIDTNWYTADPTAEEFTISTAEELAGLAALVNGTNVAPDRVVTYALANEGEASAEETVPVQESFADVTVKLGGNIDLKNMNWAPIGNWENTFEGTFDGQGYTISNLYINASEMEGVGLFGVTQKATIKNVCIENVDVKGYSMVSALVGAAYPSTISDCHVAGDINIVAEWAYVGGMAGYCYYGTQVNDCSVIADDMGSITSKTRNAVGGITAWLLEGDHKVSNCQVKNLVLTGWTNIGGITGFVHYSNTIDGCSVENVDLVKTRVDGNPGIGLIAGGYSYDATKAITIKNNTVKKATMSGTHIPYEKASDLYGSEYAGSPNANFVLENNAQSEIVNNLLAVTVAKDNTALKDAIKNDATVYLSQGEYALPTLENCEGITIVGGEGVVIGGENATTGFAGNFGKNTTIKDVIFSGKTNGVRWSYAKGGTSTFDSCTFAGDSTYGFHIDQSNGATFVFNNCTFSGFNAFAGDLTKVVFNNCTFLNNGSYGHTNIWSVAEFNNCTWGDKTSVSPAGSGKLYFNGVEESYHHEFIGSAESLFAFAKSVNEDKDTWNGQKVLLVDDINLKNQTWTPIGQTGATEFKGVFDGQNYTISNLKVDSSAQTGAHYSSGLFGWAESNVTIQNVKVDGASVTGNHNVAVIVGYTYSGKISNCHVANANITCKHANADACGDKCGLIAGYAGNESRFTDCSASSSTVTAGRDAGQLIGAGYNASMSNGSATNVTVTAGGDCTGANINADLIGRVLG